MKLKSFLNEIILADKEAGEKAAEIAKIVKKDCKPFLQAKKAVKKIGSSEGQIFHRLSQLYVKR